MKPFRIISAKAKVKLSERKQVFFVHTNLIRQIEILDTAGMGPFKNGICICIEFAFTFANFHEIENARKP